MNGIYIHIPFCKKVCYYCDFHFTVSLKWKDKVLWGISQELLNRKNYLPSKTIETIYFGGGTPSILTIDEISTFINLIHKHFTVLPNAEITLEANPDDLSPQYLAGLASIGINRLSIGIQSFNDQDLLWMNRRHTGYQAVNSIKSAQDAGFHNLNLDLIYGLPNLTLAGWQKNIDTFLSLNVPHLSAYHLTVEPKTVLGYYKRKGKMSEIDEKESIAHYNLLIETMKATGYEHYEISNFCTRGNYSQHNTNYWKQGTYLGLGPSAHSYNGQTRQWNTSVNTQYIEALENNQPYFEIEQLSVNERFNDYLLTHLRTSWGINFSEVQHLFGTNYLAHLNKELKQYIPSPLVNVTKNGASLTEEGMFVSDRIIGGMFVV